MPDAAAVEGPGPAVLAAVAARGPLRQGRDVVLGAGRHVLPGHRQPVQDAVAVALPERQRRPVSHAAAVQQPDRGHQGVREHGKRHQGVPVDQG